MRLSHSAELAGLAAQYCLGAAAGARVWGVTHRREETPKPRFLLRPQSISGAFIKNSTSSLFYCEARLATQGEVSKNGVGAPKPPRGSPPAFHSTSMSVVATK